MHSCMMLYLLVLKFELKLGRVGKGKGMERDSGLRWI